MAEVNHRTFNVQHSSGSDELSCTSEDNKRRIRKMIEVTRSTRYTTFVEGDDGTNDPSLVPSRVGGNRKDFLTTSMAVMDSSLGNLQEAIGDDKYQFAAKCHYKADQFMERLQKIDENVGECAKTVEKHQHLKAKVLVRRGQIKEKLQDVMEVSRKKRANREKILMSLMKKMC
ncbi:uncharacterized protein LOC135706589 [Ochlerotatus camptorhynchus]|uniref:uncharacterized protein LOC135706589 n=1 Tax=Ochlerotatus camptorhynchus TaxID=644619 RepID=UPI0031D7EBF4